MILARHDLSAPFDFSVSISLPEELVYLERERHFESIIQDLIRMMIIRRIMKMMTAFFFLLCGSFTTTGDAFLLLPVGMMQPRETSSCFICSSRIRRKSTRHGPFTRKSSSSSGIDNLWQASSRLTVVSSTRTASYFHDKSSSSSDDDGNDNNNMADMKNNRDALVTTTSSSAVAFGAISMQVSELARHMGGYGRAKLVWDCYRVGVDPAIFFRDDTTATIITTDEKETQETITQLLAGSRRNTRLGKEALSKLAELYPSVNPPRIQGGIASLSYISQSRDQTTKLLLKLADGNEIETVIIPWNGQRSTLCISCQVGCRQACRFCATGKMGRIRDLTSDEILSQMFWATKICRLHSLPEIQNVVFMGMGESADNAQAVHRACEILTTRELFQLSAQKVTVSTVAPTPESFRQFQNTPCVIAWSVHAANDKLRKQLVPTTKYPMVELRQGLIDVLKERPVNLRTTMLEVALMEGVNDSVDEANELGIFANEILRQVPGSKLIVNLIPFNDIGQDLYKKPSVERVRAFQETLWSHGVYTHVRATRGDDESAACGQLATKNKKSPQTTL